MNQDQLDGILAATVAVLKSLTIIQEEAGLVPEGEVSAALKAAAEEIENKDMREGYLMVARSIERTGVATTAPDFLRVIEGGLGDDEPDA